LVYTAAPVFEDPNDDPLCDAPRLVMIDGDEEFVKTPSAERLKPVVHTHVYHSHHHAPILHFAGGSDDGGDNGLIRGAMAIILAAQPSTRHDTIMREAFDFARFAVMGVINPGRALRALIRAGTQVIPGERIITPDEVTREWNHALAVKHAEWQLEQAHDSASDDEGDL
jgi:hypothetical protein